MKYDKPLMLQRDLCSNSRPGLLDLQDSKRKTEKCLLYGYFIDREASGTNPSPGASMEKLSLIQSNVDE